MSNCRPILSGVVLLLLFCTRNASAELITVGFEVTINGSVGPVADILGAPVNAGDVFRGRLTYDSALPDGSRLADFGAYSGAGHTLQLDHGAGLTLPVFRFYVYDNATCVNAGDCDVFQAVVDSTPFRDFDFISFFLDFETPRARRQGDALPTAAELASLYGPGDFFLQAMKSNFPGEPIEYALGGRTRLLDVSPVPEPGTLTLVAIGASALGIGRARKASSRKTRARHSG